MADQENDLFGSGDQDPQAGENAQDNDEFETSIQADLNPPNSSTTEPMNTQTDGANDPAPEQIAEPDIPVLETRIPAKKDASLKEFLNRMDDYAPIVRVYLHSRSPSFRDLLVEAVVLTE